jgi:transcriptional regulator with XRE-family HTH domain
MVSARHPKSERLGEKLLQIRLALGLSQDGMLERLGIGEKYFRSRISAYELGDREPHLPILLLYARSVGISTDVLIDDEMDLPAKLQKAAKQSAVLSRAVSRRKLKR